eukprot:5572821-Ditylum_brightwellii.AAC.2
MEQKKKIIIASTEENGKHKTLATLTKGGAAGRVSLTKWKDEHFRPSAERRACNIEGFSSLEDPSKNRDNGRGRMTKNQSIVNVKNGADPVSCILPMNNVTKLVGDNLICGMCVKGKSKSLEEKLINAIPYKYHGDVHLILSSVKGKCGMKAEMKHIDCATSINWVLGARKWQIYLHSLTSHMANHSETIKHEMKAGL